jgi:hypothetical protein
MHSGEARVGGFVYFPVEGTRDGEPVVRIARGEIVCIVFPGTTNEHYNLIELSSEGESKGYDLKPEDCYPSAEAARKDQILRIYVQLEVLRSKLQALGDHSLTDSRWGRRGS